MAIEDAEFQLAPENVNEPVIKGVKNVSPKAQLKGPLTVRTPSEDELAAWEEKAGVSHETPYQQRSSRAKSEWFTVPGIGAEKISELRGTRDATSLSDEVDAPLSAWESAVPGRVDAGSTNARHKDVKLTLGRAAHRMIYAKHVAGATASPEVLEHHAKEWDAMPERAQYDWQQGEGKEPTEKAIAEHNATYVQSAGAARDEKYRFREQVREAAFPSSDARRAFEEQGTLARDKTIDYINNKRDPRQRDVAGERSTQPEHDWRQAWQAGLTSRPEVGIGLGGDASHHSALAAHIDDLSRRLPHGARAIQDSRGRAIPVAGHAGETWFNQYGHIGAKGQVLQESQFLKPHDQELMSARRALAQSAKAHTMGMRDEALSYYRKAADHASNAADIMHAADKARGAQNGEVPVADWDKADRLVSNYRNSEAFN